MSAVIEQIQIFGRRKIENVCTHYVHAHVLPGLNEKLNAKKLYVG